MKTFVRWNNPNGTTKIDDNDMIAMIILSLLSPFLVLLVWLRPIVKGNGILPPWVSVVYIYKEVSDNWREVLK